MEEPGLVQKAEVFFCLWDNARDKIWLLPNLLLIATEARALSAIDIYLVLLTNVQKEVCQSVQWNQSFPLLLARNFRNFDFQGKNTLF
jgi:hypothetical protein